MMPHVRQSSEGLDSANRKIRLDNTGLALC